MSKRKANTEVGTNLANKFSKLEDTDDYCDDDDEGGSDEEKKYDIMNEDDIEGQETGDVRNDGNVEITPFNMKEEMEEGHFDSEGMYHWNKENNVRDNWLENIDWVNIKGIVAKNEETDCEDESTFDEINIYKQMTKYMKEGESVAMALRRLGGSKSLSASERLKMKKAGIPINPKDVGDKEAVTKLTELADLILSNCGNMDIYQETYMHISNKINQKTKVVASTAAKVPVLDMYADDFEEKEKSGLKTVASTSKGEFDVSNSHSNSETDVKWEFKRELSNDKIEGPYSTQQMNTWMHEKHFDSHIWVRKVGSDTEFFSSKRIDFELYL